MDDLVSAVKRVECITNVLHDGADVMHIAFGCDENYVAPMGIVIASIILNNSDERLVFHVFTDKLSDEDIHKFKEFLDNHRQSMKIYYFDPSILKELHALNHMTYAAYNRLVAAAYLHGKIAKVLYLDCDILCLGKLRNLYNEDVEDKTVVVAEDSKTEIEFQVKALSLKYGQFFNSGVMLIDLDRWNQERISSRTIELRKSRKKTIADSGDQNVLNILLDGKAKYVSKIYNRFNNFRDLKMVDQDTVLLHFVGPNKPWCAWVQFHPITKLYFEYAQKSPWHDIKLIEPRNARDRKWIAKSYKRRGKYGQAVLCYLQYFYWKMK